MKLAIPEISWHNRDPVLSVDFQPKSEPSEPLRLATGGTDSHVLIWYISIKESGGVNLEMAADLTKHQKAVNVVRWSPSGQYLASGDDESIIFVWKQKTEEPAPPLEGEEQYKETWVIHKILRGHMEDILDLSWNSSSTQLASGSVDNKLLVWDVARGRHTAILTDHKGFVQGVAWDPRGQLIASASSDRVFRTFDVSTKKVVSRSSKAVLPFPAEHLLHGTSVRLYHDDTLQTYYRRLHFSPDGLLIAVPGGSIEPEQGKVGTKPINAVYIYTRYSLKVPACVLPCGAAALVARWSPRRYAPRAGPPPALPAPQRMVLAVATKRALLVYDTQQRTPLALLTNMHYTRPACVLPCGAAALVARWSPRRYAPRAGPPPALPAPQRMVLAVATKRALLVYDTQQRTPLALLTNMHYTRPACVLPCGAAALVARWSPRRYAPRAGPPPALPAPQRMVLAVATKRALLVYDTQQRTPLALLTNMHYTRLTDLAWSADGLLLVASSTDGFCSVVSFAAGELGDVLPEQDAQPCAEVMEGTEEPQTEKEAADEVNEAKPKTEIKRTQNISKIDSFIKFKTPTEKSPKKAKIEKIQQKTPVKYDVLVETAMQSWSDNSSNDVIKPKEVEPMDVDKHDEVMVIEDSEDIKLVYEESQAETQMSKDNTDEKSPKTSAKSPQVQTSSKDSKNDVESQDKESESKSKAIESKSKESRKESDTKESKEIENKVHESPENKLSPKQCETPTSKQNESSFMKQAKVTDMKEGVTVTAAPSPKAPRRVSFVTLSSPKNTKKKC